MTLNVETEIVTNQLRPIVAYMDAAPSENKDDAELVD
jgi:hypothetical protein